MPAAHRRFEILAFALCLGLPGAAIAGLLPDTEPEVSWNELVNSEIIVTGRYVSHDGSPGEYDRVTGTHACPQTITILVEKSLKGGLFPGDTLAIRLVHWYSLATRPVDYWSFDENQEDDGIPRLCYKSQPMNPGGLAHSVLFHDIRSSAVLFFLPDADDPALERRGQARDVRFAHEWAQVLRGETPSLHFDIQQQIDSQRSSDALDRLDRTRDQETLEALFEDLNRITENEFASWDWHAKLALLELTDVDGDLYDHARELLLKPQPAPKPIPRPGRLFPLESRLESMLCELLSSFDPVRAAEDITKWLRSDSEPVRSRALQMLEHLQTETGLAMALELAEARVTSREGLRAVNRVLDQEGRKLVGSHAPRILALLERPDSHWIDSGEIGDETNYSVRNGLWHLEQLKKEREPTGKAKQKFDNEPFDWVEYLKEPTGRSQWLALPFPDRRAKKLRSDPRAVAFFEQEITKFRQGEWLAWAENHVEIYCRMFPEKRDALLDDLVEREYERIRDRRSILHAAVKLGRKDLVDDMLELFRIRPEERDEQTNGRFRSTFWKEAEFISYQPLLDAGTEEALTTYLKALDRLLDSVPSATHRDVFFPYSVVFHYGPTLDRLFDHHPALFFERVIRLLQSDRLVHRSRGFRAMRDVLKWDGGLNWSNDIGHRRDRKLAVLIPFLKRMAAMTSGIEIRAEILRQVGYRLEGEPGAAWHPELIDAYGKIRQSGTTWNAHRIAEFLIRDSLTDYHRDFNAADHREYLSLVLDRHSARAN